MNFHIHFKTSYCALIAQNREDIIFVCVSAINGVLSNISWLGASVNSRAPLNTTAWVGHPLDPIGVLFDTLAEACVQSEDTHLGAVFCIIYLIIFFLNFHFYQVVKIQHCLIFIRSGLSKIII